MKSPLPSEPLVFLAGCRGWLPMICRQIGLVRSRERDSPADLPADCGAVIRQAELGSA